MKMLPTLLIMTSLVASATVAASNYNSYSSSQPTKELRWCKGLDEPTRPLSLFYSYFVQSATEIHPEEIDPAFLTILADTLLSCPSNSSSGTSQRTRVVALDVSVEGDSRSTLPNFCENGVYCHVVLHKMTMAVQGDAREDELLLAQVLDVIDAAMDDVSNAQVRMSLIRDRPAATNNAQGLATTQVKEAEVGLFILVLLAVSLMGSMSLLLVLVRLSSNKNSSEVTIPTSITLSLDEIPPSDKVLGIRPCNLYEEHFIVSDEEEMHHWIKPNLRNYQGGFCIELHTIDEEKELDFDIEEGEGSI